MYYNYNDIVSVLQQTYLLYYMYVIIIIIINYIQPHPLLKT